MTERNGSRLARDVGRGIRWGIVGVLVAGARRRDPGAVVNAVLALVGAYLPGVLERRFDVEFRPWQRAYANAAMLTHAVGMLGPYDDMAWWDHVTHAHSATLVGAIIHVVARRRDRDPRRHVVGGVAVAGFVWELAEYAAHAASRRLGVEPVLVHYGARDTALDFTFDLLGAVLVVAFGDRLLDNFT